MTSEDFAAEEFAERKRKCLVNAGLSYTMGAVLLILLSLALTVLKDVLKGASDVLLYLSYAASQLAFFGAALFYFLKSKESPLRMTPKFHWKYLPIAVFLQFGLLFSLSRLNDFFLLPLEALGYRASEVELPALEGSNLILALLFVALLPAVFEEVLFRGILARNLHESGWGIWPVCLVSGAMFSLFHTSPEQTLYQFCCGICFSLLVIRAGSIVPTILAHFLNNATIILMTAFGLELSALPLGGYITIMILSAISLVGALVLLIFFDKKGNQKGKMERSAEFFAASGGGILICAIEWVAALVMGFLHV